AVEKGLLDGASIMVCAPTGSGKTLVGEMALLRAIFNGSRGLYLVPLRALAYQVTRLFRERYEENTIRVGVTTGDMHLTGEEMSEYDIIVTTYERADSLLRHQVAWLPEVGTVVIDEVQNLSDATRGARLESAILRMKRRISDLQIVALSATVKDPDELAEWLGCKLIESIDRPVPLVCRVIPALDRSKAIQRTVMTVVQADGQVITFHRTRRWAEAEAERLSNDVSRQLGSIERKSLDNEINSVETSFITIPPNLRRVLHHGVGYHHAGLSSNVRRMVENLFQKGMLRVVCATSTLASGMNLPARTVVLTSTRSPENHRELLSANAVHQMLGRAGRPGHDTKGFGVILTGSQGESEFIKKRYFDEVGEILSPHYDEVVSRLGTATSLTEQALVLLDMLNEASIEQLEDHLGDSFLMHNALRNLRSPMRPLHIGEITAESVIEKHALLDTVRAARQGALGRVSIRETSEDVLGGIVSGFQGGHFTCRFSARLQASGIVEGASCSCGRPVDDDGILCMHLVSLGIRAVMVEKALRIANYIVPIAMEESSPIGTLIRMGLVEGGLEGSFKITKLGRTVNRLYLGIRTVRELMALMPITEDAVSLLSLVRHLVSLESTSDIDESFENLIGAIATSSMSIRDIAESTNIPLGDAYGLLEKARWLLYSIVVLAEHGGLSKLVELSSGLLRGIDEKLQRNDDDSS
ncbi:MAG: DEAD/DEAH box helicase, partial [Candidatus Thorarchaeota archaeon SMTZ1-45]